MPVCAAYRASLLTGKYTTSTGMVINELRIQTTHDCFGHVLTRGGYQTGYIGKWHLYANVLGNHENPHNSFTPPGPDRLGFDGYWASYGFHHDNEAARIPLLVRWPRAISPGTVSEAPICNVDFMPTLLSLMGLPIPKAAEGTDFSHCARGRPGAAPEAAFMQNCGSTCSSVACRNVWQSMRLLARSAMPPRCMWNLLMYTGRISRSTRHTQTEDA